MNARSEQITEQTRLLVEAIFGLDQGNLKPLATYLRAGLPFTDVLRSNLLDVLDPPDSGWPEYFLILKKRSQGAGNVHSRTATYLRQWNIHCHVERELVENGGRLKDAIYSAEQAFGCNRSTVMSARKAVRERQAESDEIDI